MGEVAEMTLDGTLCNQCGELVLKEGQKPPGYPVTCKECLADEEADDEEFEEDDEEEEEDEDDEEE